MDFLHGKSSEIQNTDLAAALGTLGIERDPVQPYKVLDGEIKRTAFYFNDRSNDGVYVTGRMIQLWDNPSLSFELPKHAMTYMRIGLRNRDRFLDYFHGKVRIGLKTRPGGQIEVVVLDGAARLPNKPTHARPAPDASTTPRLMTDDLELASALLSCGVPLWKDFPIERNSERLSFFFMPCSPCGFFQTRELMLAWDDRKWHERHPDHPFSYLSCVFENRRRLMREIKNAVPLVTFVRHDLPQFLSANADAKTETLFKRELKKL